MATTQSLRSPGAETVKVHHLAVKDGIGKAYAFELAAQGLKARLGRCSWEKTEWTASHGMCGAIVVIKMDWHVALPGLDQGKNKFSLSPAPRSDSSSEQQFTEVENISQSLFWLFLSLYIYHVH